MERAWERFHSKKHCDVSKEDKFIVAEWRYVVHCIVLFITHIGALL
jgi:hypothetical protein